MEQLAGVVKDVVGVVAALTSAYFFVGFITNIAQAQMSSLTGDPMGRARAIQQGITMVFFLCLAGLVKPFTNQLQYYFNAPYNFSDAEGLYIFWEYITKLLVHTLIGITVTVLAVGAVYNGVGIQVSRIVGLPAGISRSMGNIITIIIGIVITLAAISFANALVEIVWSSARYSDCIKPFC